MDKDSSSGWDFHDKLIIAHAVLASAATLFTAPFAILCARYLRGHPSWFVVHITFQVLTVVLLIIVFTLSNIAVASGGHGTQFTGPKKDTHHDLGLAVFILVLVEAICGFGAHFTRTKQSPASPGAFPTLTARKSPLRLLHMAFGICVAALLYAQLNTGFDEWNMVSDAKTFVPRGIVIASWVIFALEITAYFVGWALEPLAGRKRGEETGELEETEETEKTAEKS